MSQREESIDTVKKRLRVYKACEDCKRRKVKCDGINPCGNCIKHGLVCNYDYTAGKPRRKYKKLLTKRERSTTPVSHGLYLEDQTAKLLLQLGSQQDEPLHPVQDNKSTGVTSLDTRFNSIFNDVSKLGSLDNNISPWFHYSKEKYRFHRRYQNLLPYFFGTSIISGLSQEIIQKHNLEIPRIQNYGWNMSGGHYLKLNINTSNDLAKEIFNFDNVLHISIVQKLLKYYFNNLNKPFAIIYESVFWKQFNNGFLEQRKTNTKSTKLFKSILYLMLAIALRFHDGESSSSVSSTAILFTDEEENWLYSNKTDLENDLFSYSYTIVTKLTFEWESFELIQSWLLIAFYLRTSHRQIATWNALGKAITMCKGMSLELNQLPTKHPNGDEIKSWHCFWLCFILDKLISFQVGREYQLALPIESMITPSEFYKFDENQNSNEADWFNNETIQLFELSLLATEYQKPNAQELTVDESVLFRKKLQDWLSRQVNENNYATLMSDFTPWQLQPIITYLDIAITFESKSVFALLNPPTYYKKSLDFNIDIESLLSICQLAISVLETLNNKNSYFVPWWLNLSLLFSVSMVSLTLVHCNINQQSFKNHLERCMKLWNSIELANPQNPPNMVPQCIWCLKMLNYISCLKLLNTVTFLKDTIDVNFGDNTPNLNNFHQFSKADEDNADYEHQENDTSPEVQKTTTELSKFNVPSIPNITTLTPTSNNTNITYPDVANNIFHGTVTSTPNDLFDNDLFGNLQWFDQTFM